MNCTPPVNVSHVRVSDCGKTAFNTGTSTSFMLASAKNWRPVGGESCSKCSVLTTCQKKNKFTSPRNIIIHESTFSVAKKNKQKTSVIIRKAVEGQQQGSKVNKTAGVAVTRRPGREGNLDGSRLCQTLFSGRSPRALVHSFNNNKKEKKRKNKLA